MQTKECNKCGGRLRHTTKTHSIKTRLESHKEMNIENLPIEECTICGEIEMSERSQEIIQTVKHMVKTEMQKNVDREKKHTKRSSNPIFSFFRQFIG